jgi:hypothetical protein
MPFEQGRLEEGQVIRSDFLSGPATVKKFEERPGYYKMEVVLSDSGEFWSMNATS